MIWKALKVIAIGGSGLVTVVVAVLAITGVPKPPAMTEEGLGRVGWSPIFANLGSLLPSTRSRSLVTWSPTGDGMLAWGFRSPANPFRIHRVSGPGGELEYLPAIPRTARGFHTDPGRPYAILSWDSDGNERPHLYRWDLGVGAPEPVTSGDDRHAFAGFEPGGTRMAYRKDPGNGEAGELRIVDPLDPSSERRVAELAYGWGVADWSPAGDEFLVVASSSNQANRLLTLDAATGAFTPVPGAATDSVLHGAVQYARRGGGIYYTSNRDSEYRHLRRLDPATAEETLLTGDIPWDVIRVEQTGDGERLLIQVNEDARDRYYLYDVDSGERRQLDLFEVGLVGVLLHPEQPLAIVNHTDPTGISRGYVYDLGTDELTLWVGPEPEPGVVLSTRVVRYPTFDSVGGRPREIPALLYPGVGEGPRPVVVDIHGGPHSQARLSMANTVLQERGLTVIRPNVRGSTGYGKTFMSLDNGRLRSDAVRDIGSLLDWIEAQPELDSERVMLRGTSYGGFMVFASVVDYGDRVRCAISSVGVSHPVTMLENLSGPLMGGGRPEWGDETDREMRAYLDSIAPLTNAHRIRTPILITAGANDRRVPVEESRQMVEALKKNGVQVAYLEAADEGHGFRKPWNTMYEGVAQMEMARDCLLQ